MAMTRIALGAWGLVLGIVMLASCAVATRDSGSPTAAVVPTTEGVPLWTPGGTVTLVPIATPSPPPTLAFVPTPVPLSIVGVEMMRISPKRGLALVQSAGVAWVRRNGLLWADVEPVAGARRWEAVSGLEAELRAAHDAGLNTILVIRRTPDWAQKVPGYFCGPVSDEALDDLAQFMADAVARYKDPPYAVKYWELWNEPDVDPRIAQPDWPFGCWGNQDDEYYGGQDYARMLKAVYPAIKAADPQAQVLIGGLLLDKDPAEDTLPHPPALFLEGILAGGGSDYFDIVSFHGYIYYEGGAQAWERLGAGWTGRGGAVAGKAEYLREVLTRYGLRKPLLLSEAGILCAGCSSPPPASFLAAQAEYLPRLYAQSVSLDLLATLWYPFDGPGWQESGLLDAQQEPRPAYQALQAAARFMTGARYLRTIAEYGGLWGYALEREGNQVWVLWSRSEASVNLTVPPQAQGAYDLRGAPLTPSEGVLEVGASPVYIELAP